MVSPNDKKNQRPLDFLADGTKFQLAILRGCDSVLKEIQEKLKDWQPIDHLKNDDCLEDANAAAEHCKTTKSISLPYVSLPPEIIISAKLDEFSANRSDPEISLQVEFPAKTRNAPYATVEHQWETASPDPKLIKAIGAYFKQLADWASLEEDSIHNIAQNGAFCVDASTSHEDCLATLGIAKSDIENLLDVIDSQERALINGKSQDEVNGWQQLILSEATYKGKRNGL